MPYTVKITITRGSQLEYGSEIHEVYLPEGCDDQDIFNGIAATLGKLNTDK